MRLFLFLWLGSILLFSPLIASGFSENQTPAVHHINHRLKEDFKAILRGVKTGSLTRDQAAGLKTDLKSIRQQETAYFKQNGNHELTADQQSQLDQKLDAFGQSLPK